MATLREVAKYAEVSTTVVSRVLNNKPGVFASDETRRRIFEAARTLNYRPSASAQALSTGKSRQLAISTADETFQAGSPSQLWRLLGFTDAAAERGYRVVLVASHAQRPSPDDIEALVRSGATDGICLFAEQLNPDLRELLESTQTPFTVIGDPGDDSVPQVDIDNFAYAYQSVKWLAEQGRSRILLAEFAEADGSPLRPHHLRVRSGYQAAMEQFCGGWREEWMPTRRTASSTERIASVTGPDAPHAVIVAGLLDAVMWEAALRSNGLRMPDDVLLMSYVSTLETAYLEPGLAYHAHDIRKMGSIAGHMLIDWVENGIRPTQRVLVAANPPQWRTLDGLAQSSPKLDFKRSEPTEVHSHHA